MISKEIQALLRDQDAVGSLNLQRGRFTALLVTDPYSRERLEEMAKVLLQDEGARATLTVQDADEQQIELALQDAWSCGSEYLLFE